MADPQTENGYIRITNEILDSLISAKLTRSEYKIILVVLRKTYGWNKKEDKISLSQFSQMTGISRVGVINAIKSLVKQGLLTSKAGFTTEVVTYSFQKDYDKWSTSKEHFTSKAGFTRASKVLGEQLVKCALPTKDNIQKTIKYNVRQALQEPILYLNKKANRNFDPKNKSNQNLIKARLNEGRTIEDFKKVIDKKCAQWLNNEKMMVYLRPSTLFNATKFENYLNEPDLITKQTNQRML